MASALDSVMVLDADWHVFDCPRCRDFDAIGAWLRWAKRVDLLAQLPAQETGGVGPMMGGNFALGDGRWSEAFGSLPIPIHDRIETAEQYRLNSAD